MGGGSGSAAIAATPRRRGRRRLVVLLLILLLVVAGVALYAVFGGQRAAAASATVSVVQTAMEAQRSGGSFSTVLDGEILATGDQVRTDGSGRGFLTFFDGSTLEVEPGAHVAVAELSRGNDGTVVIRLEQSIGRTWASVQKFANPNSRFEIKTPASTAVVRGTAFETIVLPDLTTIVKATDGTVLVQAQGVEQVATPNTQVTTTVGQPPAPPQTVPPAPSLRFSSTAGTGITVFTPNNLGCGPPARTDAPGCVAGSVILKEVLVGTYTILMTASAAVNATLTMEGLFGEASVSTQALTQAMNRGDLVRTTLQISLGGQGRPALGTPTPFETINTVCGAEARGRVFSSGTFEERNGALSQYASANKNQPAALVYSDAELNATLQQAIESMRDVPITVSKPRVQISINGLEFGAEVTGGPVTVNAKATIVAGAEGGRLTMRLKGLDLGPIPGAIGDQLRTRIEQALSSVGDTVPIKVERVAFRAGCIAIIGLTR